MSPQVHVELIQICPENLRASEPQMTIEMCHLMHNHITFKCTTAPGLRAVSEKSEVLTDGQSWPSIHDLPLELPDRAPVPECLELMVESTEHEAEDVPPASADPEYISMNPTNKECHVNNESLEQADRSGIGHTDGPNPTN